MTPNPPSRDFAGKTLSDGTYLIRNTKHDTLVRLADEHGVTNLTSKVNIPEVGRPVGSLWLVKADRRPQVYSLRNFDHGTYPFASRRAKRGQAISNHTDPQFFRVVESNIQGQYFICTTISDLHWSLPTNNPNEPVTLHDNPDGNPDDLRGSLWSFVPTSTDVVPIPAEVSFGAIPLPKGVTATKPPSGKYVIFNANYLKLACLPEEVTTTTQICSELGDESEPAECPSENIAWAVTEIGLSGRFRIQSMDHKKYAATNRQPLKGSGIGIEFEAQPFGITQVPGYRDRYVISTLDGQLYWRLPTGSAYATIILDNRPRDPDSHWTLIPARDWAKYELDEFGSSFAAQHVD